MNFPLIYFELRYIGMKTLHLCICFDHWFLSLKLSQISIPEKLKNG
ncbi:hypothetical protein C943_01216 [Mariniradius saccharolyticus AK6]|uniref:Uncharacterized protein n=1 Tax=Mariniradius saccharolyticus AK6 TaxID=1239962 RepID=M7XC94_9BACT|nr:hypothetical protein C943_01216 [Mariniradius saccharolyticus AK6]